jgi:orotidine-5'-phosphate decarboxylase
MKQNPIICAIDTPDIAKAKEVASQISSNVGGIKLGLEFFCKNGPDGIKEVASSGTPIFLDLKFHDIPNTVEKAVRSISSLPCFMTTIHMLNGRETIKRCVNLKSELENLPMLIGVTILTSHSDISEIGINLKIQDEVLMLAEIAAKEGMDGIVCSPHEIEIIKKNFGDSLKLICPGIRPEGISANDQKRIMTPKQAIEYGADYLVIGRPITESTHLGKTSKEICDSLK